MTRLLARFAVARPRVVLAAALLVVAVLAVVGQDVEQRMKPTQLYVSGTETYRAHELASGHYGDAIALQLTGPKAEIDRQGPRLAQALTERPRTRALTPWSGGAAGARLRPTATDAVLLLDVRRTGEETASSVLPPLRRFAEQRTSPPVRVHMAGVTEVGRSYNDTIVHSIRQAELLAAPILLLVLLLVFRTPLAAAIPALVALGTVLSGYGVVRILSEWVELDAVTLNMASMIGLALGVDYSLLLVSRFREALAEGEPPAQAAMTSATTAGRTAAFAGLVLIALMTVVLLVAPGSAMLSSAVGSIVVAVIGVLGAVLVTPAAVRLVGTRIDAWPILRRRAGDGPGRLGGLVRRVTARPWPALLIAGALCLVAALPAVALKTIPPDPRQLPKGTQALEDFQALRRVGFGPEVEVVLRSDDGPLTDPANLQAIDGLQRRLARLRAVRFVAGPADVGRQTGQVQRIGGQLQRVRRQVDDGRRQLARLDSGLGRAGRGVAQLRAGLGDAASGARRIQDGTGQARDGGDALAAGAERAVAGSRRLARGTGVARDGFTQLDAGLRQAQAGVTRLVAGARAARAGAGRLRDGTGQLVDALGGQLLPGAEQLAAGLRRGRDDLRRLREPAQIATAQARAALDALNRMSVGKLDPDYAAAYRAVATAVGATSGRNPLTGEPVAAGYDGLDPALGLAVARTGQAVDGADRLAAGLRQATAGARELDGGAQQLRRGLVRLDRGQRQLRDGVGQLHDRVGAARPDLRRLQAGATTLEAGMGDLRDGAARLRVGLARLGTAQARLARGLGDGVTESAPLAGGLGDARRGVSGYRGQLADAAGPNGIGQLDALQRRSPGFFRSGYVAAAALAGARPLDRQASEMLVDTAHGATFGRIVLLPDLPTNDPRTTALVAAVRGEVSRWQRDTGITAAVGGGASQLSDFDAVTKARIPLLTIAMSLVIFLLLVVVLRSLLLPALAVALNLLTVAVSMGVLTFLFTGDHPILGGAGSLDVLMISAVFAVTFALSIDYQVFLLSRMREGYVRTGSNDGAIDFGVRRTATVVTSAAAIMVSVFTAFAFAEFVAVKQMGVGLAVAVLVDATVVRLVLLPAAMTLLGERTWWLPAWLDRRLPHVDVEGVGDPRPTRRPPRPSTTPVVGSGD